MLELEIKSIQNFVAKYEILREENIDLKLQVEKLKKELQEAESIKNMYLEEFKKNNK